MKKLIPILIAALLLAVGLALPAAGPADAIEPIVTVTKTADPTSVPEPGDNVEFTVIVTNDGLENVVIDSLVDSDFNLASYCPDAAGTPLASGETYTCVFTVWIAGNVGDNHENTATAIVSDDAGNAVSASDDATVTVEDVQPAISVIKSADPTSVPEPGDDVTFTVDICNDSIGSDTIIITSLVDTIYGDLNGQGDCSLPQDIVPGDCYTCSFIAYVAGNAGHVETDVVTAVGTDDEGNPVSDDDDAIVTVESPVNDVDIDIKPGSFPNSLNVKSKGVLPVAILGTAAFDVMTVDPLTVMLGWDGIHRVRDVPPLRWAWEDVNDDGIMDIVFKYSMEVMRPLTVTHEAPGDLIMMLEGELQDGTSIEGYDTVRIINKDFDGP